MDGVNFSSLSLNAASLLFHLYFSAPLSGTGEYFTSERLRPRCGGWADKTYWLRRTEQKISQHISY
jgi:hypothetical protein